MKKLAIATLIAMAATAASALEVTVVGTRDYSGATNRNGAGVVVSEQFGKVVVGAGVESLNKGSDNQDRYSLTAGYDLAKFGTVTVAPQVGVTFLDNQASQDGYAMTIGVGVTVPLTKQVGLTAAIARQYGQDRVQTFDGNRFTVGVKYGF